jgi:hypothetical protein
MAVALNPTKTLYSKKGENSERSERNNTITSSASNNFMSASSYADSPSRQLRRSARVASLSPSSFTPLISEQSSSGSTSGTSSYMPTSPSSKYSMMRGGYNGVSIDEIVINEIEPENNRGIKNREKSTKPPLSSSSSSSSSFYPTLESFTNLRSNPDRKHPTLDFQPTNLSTPSTTLSQNNKSGITPAIKQINLHQQQETTPGQVFLENLVTKGDMEEIAKATPLGSYYNRKSSEAVVGVGADKSKIQIISEKSRASGSYSSNSFNSTINPQNNSFSTSLNRNSQSSNNSNNSNSSNSSYQAHNYTNRNAVEMVKTPQKQTNDPVIDSDETVKVVRTLRNRSIVASPLPATSSKSLAPSTSRENKPKIDVTVLFKKHQKNLLAYSLVSLFLFATIYHIYDGLFSIGIEDINSSSSSSAVGGSSGSAVGSSSSGAVVSGDNLVPVNQSEKEEILKLIETKFTEIQEVENEKVLNLFEKVEKIEKENPAVTAEQKKELERVSKLVEKLEEKFEELETKLEKEREKEKEKEREKKLQSKEKEKEKEKLQSKSESKSNPHSNPHSESNSNSKILTSHPHHFAHLKIVKHLSTSPIGSGLFKSSQFPPENAISPQPIPFKFSGNRGKLALFVILPHTPHNPPSHLILEHPLLPDRSCAPKDFEIWALRNVLNERDNPVLIFKGTFDLSKESQSFSLNQERLNKLIKDRTVLLQLRIRNNHGNSKFTCLYNLKFQI